MRAAALLVAVLVSLMPAASVQAAERVRVAVVGFTGDLPAAALAELAQAVRGSLGRQANEEILEVVSRDEMARVYQQRGAACRPDDIACVVEASAAWSGRLFVRGVVRSTSEGIIIGATLESVRGVLVAAAQTPTATQQDLINAAVPVLVRDLLDGERAYRQRSMERARAVGADPAEASAGDANAPPMPTSCKAVAMAEGAIPGELFVDDAGVRFESAATAERPLRWRYTWARVKKSERTRVAGAPGLVLEATTADKLTLSFATAREQDQCLALLALHEAVGRRPAR